MSSQNKACTFRHILLDRCWTCASNTDRSTTHRVCNSAQSILRPDSGESYIGASYNICRSREEAAESIGPCNESESRSNCWSVSNYEAQTFNYICLGGNRSSSTIECVIYTSTSKSCPLRRQSYINCSNNIRRSWGVIKCSIAPVAKPESRSY